MGLTQTLGKWYDILIGRDKFKYKSAQEAFEDWDKKSRDLIKNAQEAYSPDSDYNPLFYAYTSQIMRNYMDIVSNMPPQDRDMFDKMIRKKGVEILVEDENLDIMLAD
ncbi:MAG TPA: hypothetical protein VJ438_00605 [Candidatus Nanoarchaeia archaeon]|nr:hypothetical protein [Candidatus Nanoarchaeia archaeon]